MIGDSKAITLTTGVVVYIPNTFSYFRCKNAGCGATDLVWARTKNGRSMPIHWVEDEGWVCHFADCPGADKFRKKRRKKK